MSKLLIKALKSAILPCALLIVGKFLGIFALIATLGIHFSVANEINSFFSVQIIVDNVKTATMIDSVSNFICLLLIVIPTLVFFIKNTLLLDARSNPRVVVKLSRLNILKWVTGKENSLITVVVWSIFLWIISGLCISNTINNGMYVWIGITAGVFSLLSIYGILRTFEKETARIYPEDK